MSHFIGFFQILFLIPPCYLKTNAHSLAAKLPGERWREGSRVGAVEAFPSSPRSHKTSWKWQPVPVRQIVVYFRQEKNRKLIDKCLRHVLLSILVSAWKEKSEQAHTGLRLAPNVSFYRLAAIQRDPR